MTGPLDSNRSFSRSMALGGDGFKGFSGFEGVGGRQLDSTTNVGRSSQQTFVMAESRDVNSFVR